MRLAIVSDPLTTFGGMAVVCEVLHAEYPDAPIYTAGFVPQALPPSFTQMDVRTGPWASLLKRPRRRYLGLQVLATESFDLRPYDVVISVSHACAKGVLTRPDTLHVGYCLTPMRDAWTDYWDELRSARGPLNRAFCQSLLSVFRVWDVVAANRVDRFVSISSYVASLVEKIYRRESAVIHPPVATSEYSLDENGPHDYFLCVSRLTRQKMLNIALDAFRELQEPLVIIGDGPERRRLEAQAPTNVSFLGYQPQPVVRKYLSQCRAFVMPGLEDFGLTAVEAQASGRPVVALGRGGALDSIIPGLTGTLFEEPTPASLAEAVRRTDFRAFNRARIREHAESFDTQHFRCRLRQFIDEAYEAHMAKFSAPPNSAPLAEKRARIP